MIRIGFFGTPHFSASILHVLLSTPDIEVVFAVTNPQKPIGKSRVPQPTPVAILAQSHHIPLFTPLKITGNTDFLDAIRAYNCDYFVVAAYGKILPQSLLDIPKAFCINVHGSILPAYRGASPIQSALIDGISQTGVTIMKMSLGMDEGDILSTNFIDITPNETTKTLFEKFEKTSPKLLVDTIFQLKKGTITPIAQDHAQATYCQKITKEQGNIDWKQSAKTLYHLWQAYTPWPGIFTYFHEKRLLLETISYRMEDISPTPGTVVQLPNKDIAIACGKGYLTLQQIKLEGKKSQNIKDFINGNANFIGSSLHLHM